MMRLSFTMIIKPPNDSILEQHGDVRTNNCCRLWQKEMRAKTRVFELGPIPIRPFPGAPSGCLQRFAFCLQKRVNAPFTVHLL